MKLTDNVSHQCLAFFFFFFFLLLSPLKIVKKKTIGIKYAHLALTFFSFFQLCQIETSTLTIVRLHACYIKVTESSKTSDLQYHN